MKFTSHIFTWEIEIRNADTVNTLKLLLNSFFSDIAKRELFHAILVPCQANVTFESINKQRD